MIQYRFTVANNNVLAGNEDIYLAKMRWSKC